MDVEVLSGCISHVEKDGAALVWEYIEFGLSVFVLETQDNSRSI